MSDKVYKSLQPYVTAMFVIGGISMVGLLFS